MQKIYFVSGTMCTEDLWQFIFPHLTNIHPIYIDITSASSFEDINMILLETIKHPAILVGFSLGGFSIMNFATQYPNYIKKLVVIAADTEGLNENEILLRKSTIEFLNNHNYKGISQSRIEQFLHPDNHKNEEITSIIRKMDSDLGKSVLIKQLKATSSRIDITEKLKNTKLPILFISAQNDTIAPPTKVKATSKNMQKAVYVNIKSCGHMIPLEKPRELIYLLNSNLN